MKIISIGEILWDVFGSQEFLGGAPLNFAVNSQRLGSSATVFSAVGDDPRGRRALEMMEQLAFSSEFVQVVSDAATGAAIITSDGAGDASFSIERPAAFDCLHVTEDLLAQLASWQPGWIYFGTLAQTNPRNEEMLHTLLSLAPQARRFYDMNLRQGHWNAALVERLSTLASVLKLNEAEAKTLWELASPVHPFSLDDFCRLWSSTYNIDVICTTLGEEGCAVFSQESLNYYPGFSVKVLDTVGAGDAFSAAFLRGLDQGWPMERNAGFANALGAIVASRAGATPPWSEADCLELIAGTGISDEEIKNNAENLTASLNDQRVGTTGRQRKKNKV